jgi:succinoglycan biosynthesis protein ExoM
MTAAGASQSVHTHKIAVGICTHNRPAGLAALLSALNRLRLTRIADQQVLVIVVDNGEAGSARPVYAEHADKSRFSINYVQEPRKGLAFARNAVMAAAREAGATHLAWIDDDEAPEPGWLEALYAGLLRAGSAAAIGPVYPMFEGPPPDRLPTSAFVIRRTPREGLVSDAYTCNCMMDMAAVVAAGLVFDDRYNHTGGEDTAFFKRLKDAGGTIAWVEDAIVNELVPRHRMSAAWLWRRWYRTGALEANLSRYDPASMTGRLINLTMGLARVGYGSARVVAGCVRSLAGTPGAFVASFYTVCRGMGLIAKVFGRDYNEYSVPTYR